MRAKPIPLTFALAALLAGGAAALAEGEAQSYTVAAHFADAGEVHGRVRFEGQATEPRVWEVTEDPTLCGATKKTQSVRVTDGGLADVVVAIRGITQGKSIGPGPTLSQQQCELVPRVMAMTVGQRLTIVNRDPLPVLISGRDQGDATVFRFLQPTQGSKHKKHITEAGLIRIQGDEDRPWSRAVVYVAEHPYVTVTADDGGFSLADVPPGSWEVVAWHETLGTRIANVTVPPGGQGEVEFLFGGAAQ